MIRKNLMKSLSVIMAAMLAVMTVACGQNTVANESAEAVEIQQESDEEETLQKSLMSASNVVSGQSQADKVETVYVTADANGAVNDVIVSEWLKNAGSTAELSDKTQLHDIVNVKGDETYKDNGDGTLTWDAEGSDIYYQGSTDKELPVKMKITYTLDGKEISPEELAGKSGKVTMRFDYENNDRQTVEVNGKEVEVYTPFAMVSGMMLDSEKFTNVEITNGKVISDGGNIIVMGVAVPGLKESLDISEDKWDELEDADEIKDKLSNSFEVTADTTDFELGMTITMASSDILSDFGMEDLSGSDKLDELKDDMNDLNDGSNKLVDGAHELKDGTGEFVDGTQKLYDGATELKDGTQKLYDGTGTLLEGTGALSDGAGTLAEGIYKYTDGTEKINSGAKSLAEGAGSLKDGTASLKKAMDDAQMVKGANDLAKGVGSISDGLNLLGEKVKNLSGAMAGLAQLKIMYAQADAAEQYLTGAAEWNEMTAKGMYLVSGGKLSDKETVDRIIAGAQGGPGQVKEALSTLKTMVENYEENVLEVSYGTLFAADDEDIDEEDKQEDKKNESTDTPAPVEEDLSEEDSVNDSAETVKNVEEKSGDEDKKDDESKDDEKDKEITENGTGSETENQETGDETKTGEKTVEEETVVKEAGQGSAPAGSKTLTPEQYQQLLYYVSSLAAGESIDNVVNAVGTYNQLLGSAQAIKTTIAGVQEGMGDISFDEKSIEDLQTLINGAKAAAVGSASLAQGVSAVYGGTVKLDQGAGKLQQGAKELAAGTKTLVSNNDDLNDGAGKLRDGASELNKGAGELNDGARQLNDGTGELKDGTKELYDGAVTLDDGVKELVDGITKFDEEGIKKLYEAFDGDISDFTDRLTAIQKAAGTYKSFGGSSDDVDSSVKFIIKTDSIKDI